MTALQLEAVTVRFGGLVAVNDLSLQVRPGTIHSLIGPNGAGKSTVINTVMGLCRPEQGSIVVAGQEVVGLRPDLISRLGVARTFQNTEMFGEMTVLDNVLVGAHTGAGYGTLPAVLRTKWYRAAERRIRNRARELLDVVGLAQEERTVAGNLPFAKQRALELARALATEPKLLLLDEPAAGLRSAEIDQFNTGLRKLRNELGLTVLLVDHVMKVVLSISDRVTVLNFGIKIAEETAEEVRGNPEVRRAYLGDDAAHA